MKDGNIVVSLEGEDEVEFKSDEEKNSQQKTGRQQPAFNSDAIASCIVISNERSHKGTRVYIS